VWPPAVIVPRRALELLPRLVLGPARIHALSRRTLLPGRLLPLVGAAKALPAATGIRLLLLRLLPWSLLALVRNAAAVSWIAEALPAAAIILLTRRDLLRPCRLL